jgi:CRISPR/Cas system Type II protein with McrA/HNH and RuvC-like nuclease domain
MARSTPSYAKNIIRRCFTELFDPELSPAQRSEIWNYFENRCAYCGKKLNRSKREGHIDHLMPASLDGSNFIGNRVLSCASCNAEEKRDRFWVLFIKEKDGSDERIKKIKNWQQRFSAQETKINPQYREYANKLANEVTRDLDMKVKEFRKKIQEA